MKIGVFDSGVGGLTVLAELKRRFPGAQYVYLGDTANVPYGTKSPVQIECLSLECAWYLKSQKIDSLVVACNTASSWALPALRKAMGSIPVFGVVEPGAQAVQSALLEVKNGASPNVLVLATRATVQSHAYQMALKKKLDRNCRIIEQACPLLVPMIEEGWVKHPILDQTILEYVAPHIQRFKPGIALLGCTHYPWIQAAFKKALPGWKVINSAQAIADALEAEGVLGKKSSRKGSVEWVFTDPDAVPAFAQKLIGRS